MKKLAGQNTFEWWCTIFTRGCLSLGMFIHVHQCFKLAQHVPHDVVFCRCSVLVGQLLFSPTSNYSKAVVLQRKLYRQQTGGSVKSVKVEKVDSASSMGMNEFPSSQIMQLKVNCFPRV